MHRNLATPAQSIAQFVRQNVRSNATIASDSNDDTTYRFRAITPQSRWVLTLFGTAFTALWLFSTGLAQGAESYPYTVQPGDTWQAVAELTGIPIPELQALNGQAARRSGLLQGEILTVPVTPLSYPTIHLVQAGESWNSIASDYAVSVRLLQAVNPRRVNTSRTLYRGTTLLIPNPSPLDESAQTLPLVELGTLPATEIVNVDTTVGTVTETLSMSDLLSSAGRSYALTTSTVDSNYVANTIACQERGRYIEANQRVGAEPDKTPVRIDFVEVTQAIPPANRQFIVNRSTAILATIKPTAALSETLSVTGCAHILVNGQYSETVTALATVMISNTAEMLIFEPLIPSYAEDVDLDIEIIDVNQPLTLIYHYLRGGNFRFILDSVEPLLYYVPVDFKPVSTPEPKLISPGNGDAFLKAVLPVSDQKTGWRYEAAQIPPIFVEDKINNGRLDCTHDQEGKELFARLIDLRETLVTTYTRQLSAAAEVTVSIGSMEHVLLYGWVADPENTGTVPCYGYTQRGSDVAFGTTLADSGQRTYAHEVYHLIHNDIGHLSTATPIKYRGWDVDNRLPGTWAVMNITQEKPTENTFALMTDAVANATDRSWITDVDYQQAIDFFCAVDLLELAANYPECPPGANIGANSCIVSHAYIVRGGFDPSGVALLEGFTRVSQSPWYSQPTYTYMNHRNQEMPFRMLLYDGERLVAEIPFDAQIHVERQTNELAIGTRQYGLFNLVIEPSLFEQADRIMVSNIDGEILPLLERSNTEPTIAITEPITAAAEESATSTPVLSSTITIEVEDIDEVDQRDLTCHFTYSPDNGATWVPVQVQPQQAESVYDTQIAVPCQNGTPTTYIITQPEQLLPSRNRGILRAFVSDGFHVRYTDTTVQVGNVEDSDPPVILSTEG